MSEDSNNRNDAANDPSAQENETGPPTARIRRTPWRGWIWAVPLAAGILVGYLVVRTWVLAGPTVTVTFANAAGIGPTGAPVRYKGMQVGTVSAVQLADNLKDVKVTLNLHSDMAPFLHAGTKFWIVQPTVMSGDFSDLLSGPYIEMVPGPPSHGKSVYHFKGLLHPPNVSPDQPGQTLVLDARHAGKLQYGSTVLYHGFPAGKVLGVNYDQHTDQVHVTLFIRSPFDQRLTKRSRFWRSGNLSFASSNGGFGLHVPAIKNLLQGAVSFDNIKTARAKHADHHLYDSHSAAVSPLIGSPTIFALHPPGSVAGLSAGSPVRYQGIIVGRVKNVSLTYDGKTGQLRTPVQIALYPNRFGLPPTAHKQNNADLQKRIAALIARGLRARVETSNLLLNEKQISLVMLPNVTPAALHPSAQPPRIPCVAGSGVSQIIASVSRITHRINAIPFEKIGKQVASTVAHIKALAASPQVKQSIAHLNKTLANAEDLTSEAKGQIKPTLKDVRSAINALRRAAAAAQATANTVTRIAGGSISGAPDVQRLVGELTRTARSIRGLADYLQRHPEALLRGRATQ